MTKLKIATVFIILAALVACSKLKGEKGDAGAPGSSCSVQSTSYGVAIVCTDGTTGNVFNGVNGVDAEACSTETIPGGVKITCPNGTVSTVYNGSNGSDGQDGSDGQNGTDGTTVTAVKLCPGTTVYPSSFPEYALCLNSKLYAVYWSTSAFLAEIVPGHYSSTSNTVACSFTVHPGCVIEN